MFDILLYLYDTYLFSERFPEPEQLSRKLSAAGFEDADIGAALNWLAALGDLSDENDDASLPSLRCYSEREISRLATEGRGFLTFLEGSKLLSPRAREWVIEQAMALEDSEVSADHIKWIALLALWKLNGAGDVLWLEDLVRAGGEEDDWQPTLH